MPSYLGGPQYLFLGPQSTGQLSFFREGCLKFLPGNYKFACFLKISSVRQFCSSSVHSSALASPRLVSLNCRRQPLYREVYVRWDQADQLTLASGSCFSSPPDALWLWVLSLLILLYPQVSIGTTVVLPCHLFLVFETKLGNQMQVHWSSGLS